jgi:hypothetical protein
MTRLPEPGKMACRTWEKAMTQALPVAGCLLLVGHVSDGLVESLRDGWTLLLGEGLKR